MEELTRKDDVMLLLDRYSRYGQDLYDSLVTAGLRCPVAVIDDNGFLPEGMISIFSYFLGDFTKDPIAIKRPRYFNEIQLPDYWEIRASGQSGSIYEFDKLRGRIFYAEPLHKRLVVAVDWLDDRGIVRSTDHYNKFGALYARTIFNLKGQKVNKSYFSPEGREIIMENYVTKDVILNDGEIIHFFPTRVDFVTYFLKKAGFVNKRLFFNSLSTPFFVSQQMQGGQCRNDVLFWQEPITDDIPGNMQIILSGKATHTKTIMVQMQGAYDRLVALGADTNVIHRLGFIYSFEREHQLKPEILICTNSDQIEHCEELVKALPQYQFHIAALTEMSSSLLQLGVYKNVSLYPGIKRKMIDTLFDQTDIYLDINWGSEIISAIRTAFLHNQLIFAFRQTLHNKDYVAEEHIYEADQYEALIKMLKGLYKNREEIKKHLKLQHEAAVSEDVKSYRGV